MQVHVAAHAHILVVGLKMQSFNDENRAILTNINSPSGTLFVATCTLLIQ
ncbi:hypothetical protein JHK87_015695 [Glycine soja]|nr:hypothetical protein JHK87_015695 [Glycine soja]